MAFEGRAVVFDGPEDYHARIDDPALAIDEDTVLFMRGVGPIGYPGARRGGEHARPGLPPQARHPFACLHRRRAAVRHLRARPRSSMPRRKPPPAAGWRSSGRAIASASTSAGAPPTCWFRQRNSRRGARRCGMRAATPIRRTRRPGRKSSGPSSRQLETGMVLEPAVKYLHIAQTMGIPRDNH